MTYKVQNFLEHLKYMQKLVLICVLTKRFALFLVAQTGPSQLKI